MACRSSENSRTTEPGCSSASSNCSLRNAIGRWRNAAESKPRTFSITKKRGLIASINRRYSQSNVPRGSCTVPLRPAVLNDWHGGPPITRSTSPYSRPQSSKIFTGSCSVISPSYILISALRFPLSRLARIVSQNAFSFSRQATTSNLPVFSNPMSNPIAPEKSEITLYFLGFLRFFTASPFQYLDGFNIQFNP